MEHFGRFRRFHPQAASSVLAWILCSLPACEKRDEAAPSAKEPAPTAKVPLPAPATPLAVTPVETALPALDPTTPCAVPSASAEHVAKILGTGALTGPRAEQKRWTHRCYYQGAEAITIDVDVDATSKDLEALQKSAETAAKVPMQVHAGFGDKALSQVIRVGTEPQVVEVNSLGVLKGTTLVYLASKAPLDKIQALEADLLKDLAKR